jgi:hypothetical protein
MAAATAVCIVCIYFRRCPCLGRIELSEEHLYVIHFSEKSSYTLVVSDMFKFSPFAHFGFGLHVLAKNEFLSNIDGF